MKLAIIVPHFNPCGYRQPRKNFQRFIDALRQQADADDVFVIEALFPGQSREHGWWARAPIPADDRHFLWQKESLINFAIQRLPPKCDAVAWIDADILFDDNWWYEQACKTLEEFPVVQLFDRIIYEQRRGDYSFDPGSRGYSTASEPDRLTFNAPGGAIACRRELLTNGIYDRHPLGGGDEIFMDACLGRAPRFYKDISQPFRDHIRGWCESFGQHPVGFLRGSVTHLWHGDREGRQYTTRHALLGQHDFDPAVDVRIGENGLLEWASDKPALHAAVRDFFTARAEDG